MIYSKLSTKLKKIIGASLLSSSMVFTSFVPAFAQLEQTIHQTFEIGEASRISLDLMGELETQPWAGNNVLTETKIQIFDASPAILKYFIEEAHRYQILADTSGNQIVLRSFDKERKTIRTNSGECFEYVHVRIFVPEEFEKVDEVTLVREKEAKKKFNKGNNELP